jgi:hypothetical protein
MLNITWYMNSGDMYKSTMEGKSWEDVADFVCDNPDFIIVHNDDHDVVLVTKNISEFVVEAAK